MPDWPTIGVTPANGTIFVGSTESLGVTARCGGSYAGAVWPAQFRAIYIPFYVESTITAYQMAFEVAVQSGNFDIGIYDSLGNRLVSKGSTAVGVAGIQVVDITNTLLRPGTYYMAMCVDNTTASIIRSGTSIFVLQVSGVQQQAVGAVTLPDPATFANPASAYLPGISIATIATI